MRLKTFHASSMMEAMHQVREELGADAIIIQSEEGKNGVRITAALEAGATPAPPEKAPKPEQTPLAFEETHGLPPTADFDAADIKAVLNHHALPFETSARVEQAATAMHAASLAEAICSGLETTIAFNPLTDAHLRPIMLVGPPGAGKTICAAKLTADALLHERTVQLISTDTVKAAGIHQLDHFAQLMKQTVSTASSPEELRAVVSSRQTENCLTVIDSPGTNPFDMTELKELLTFIHSVDAEPVLVMPAGLDPLDAQEIAGVFSRMGCQRFVATRLDAARRYAGIVMAARPGFLSLAAISRSPFVADGLEAATPMAFSRLFSALPRGKKSNLEMDANND
jgi:flagellar biosynthesis protein FlhF